MGQKILIVKPTALGDVAQTCLLVPAIKEAHPDWHVSWVVDEDYRELVQLCSGVDEVIAFPRRRWKKNKSVSEVVPWFRQIKEKQFDAALDLQGLARSALMTFAASRRIGFASAREFACLAYNETIKDDAPHAVDRYRQAIEHLIGKKITKHYQLNKPSLPENLSLLPDKYTVLHPYSIWETKLWPWDYYYHLTKSLPGEAFVLVGKGGYFPCSASNIADFRNRTTLSELLAILAHARAVISTDSGPAHLAAALGRPLITLFGSTDPKKTKPIAPKSIILNKKIPCQPCLKRICRHTSLMQCLREITVDEVKKAWEKTA